MWLAAALLAGAALLVVAQVPDTRSPAGHDEPPPPLLYRPALAPGVALLTGGAPAAGFLAFGVLYARDLGIERWSLVPFTYAGTVVMCRILFAKLPDRVPAAPLAIAALSVGTAGLVILGVARHPAGLMAAAILIGLGTALLTPSIFALVFARSPAHMRGSAAATTSIFIDLGLSGGPILIGLLAATLSVPAAFLTIALLPVAGALVLAASAVQGKKRPLPRSERVPLGRGRMGTCGAQRQRQLLSGHYGISSACTSGECRTRWTTTGVPKHGAWFSPFFSWFGYQPGPAGALLVGE